MPDPSRTVLVVLWLVAATSTAAVAQTQFVDGDRGQVPKTEAITDEIHTGDLDGDGDLDLVLLDSRFLFYPWGVVLWINEGAAGLREVRVPVGQPNKDVATAVGLADVDGDKDLDLLVGVSSTAGTGGQNVLYLNDGRAGFAPAAGRLPAMLDTANQIVPGDVDADGDIDFAVAAGSLLASRFSYVLLNDGKGRFQVAPSTPSQHAASAAVADVDRDGDLDVLLRGAKLWLWLGDNKGGFVDSTAGRFPGDVPGASSQVWEDVDADGDPDLILGVHDLASGAQNRLWLNDGKGRFADATALRLPKRLDRTVSLLAADVNGDGRRDLVVGDLFGPSRILQSFGGIFRDAPTALPQSVGPPHALAAVDLDGDKDIDIVFGNHGRNQLLTQVASGRFVDNETPRLPPSDWLLAQLTQVVLADFDGDTVPDAFLVSAVKNRLLRNDGRGAFQDVTKSALPGFVEQNAAAVAVDVDRDTDLDLIVAADLTAAPNRMLLNDGMGFFKDATSRLPNVRQATSGVACGDVNGDRNVDLVFANNGRNALYLGDGTGGFQDASARLPVDNDASSAAVLLDAEGDRDLDLVFANRGGPNRIYINDGKGNFKDETSSRLPAVGRWTVTAIALDADEDGDTDLIAGGSGEMDRLFLNDGKGVFTDGTAGRLPSPPSNHSLTMSACDVDEDGHLDLVIGTGAQPRLLLGNGKGVFFDATAKRLPPTAGEAPAVAAADLDGDRDVDLFQIRRFVPPSLLINRLRAVRARGIAELGADYRLELGARVGFAPPGQFVVPYFRVDVAPPLRVLPFGVWHLGHTGFVGGDAFPVPAPAGLLQGALRLPNAPNLAGRELAVQALVFHGATPRSWRLSNALVDRLER